MNKNTNDIHGIKQKPMQDSKLRSMEAPKAIQDLLDKYLAGETSNEEEAELRIYFDKHDEDIPEDWKSYRALFSYIDFEKQSLSSLKTTPTSLADNPTKIQDVPKRRPIKLLAWATAAIVALALIITGIHQFTKPQTEYYAVIDGKVYTDKSLVHDEALDALQEVSTNAKEDDAFSALNMMQ